MLNTNCKGFCSLEIQFLCRYGIHSKKLLNKTCEIKHLSYTRSLSGYINKQAFEQRSLIKIQKNSTFRLHNHYHRFPSITMLSLWPQWTTTCLLECLRIILKFLGKLNYPPLITTPPPVKSKLFIIINHKSFKTCEFRIYRIVVLINVCTYLWFNRKSSRVKFHIKAIFISTKTQSP